MCQMTMEKVHATPARLSNLREMVYLKKYMVAQIIGVTPNTYARWENGIHEFKQESLYDLALLYGVSVDYLIGLTTDKTLPSLDKDAINRMNNLRAYALKLAKDAYKPYGHSACYKYAIDYFSKMPEIRTDVAK